MPRLDSLNEKEVREYAEAAVAAAKEEEGTKATAERAKEARIAEAREQMLAAVANNPWLSEKALLAKGAPLGLKGEDI